MADELLPQLIKGGLAVDDRGTVGFVNDFDFLNEKIRRFYSIENHNKGFIRAWHGHKIESKYVLAIKGSSLVCCVKVDNWENPSKQAKVWRFVLSDKNPSILFIPAGYANGHMSLNENTQIIVFSNKTLTEGLKDDIRYESHYWDPWQVEER
jgi:dTDP-4-dehydrorhamnose 3,5-epimerase